MTGNVRKSGIDIIGNIPWGTHICQFYQTREDLMNILSPFFKVGLENNEFCMWIASSPITVEDIKKEMQRVLPDIEDYLSKKQIEIVPHAEWYFKEGVFDLQRVLSSWLEKLNQAIGMGYEGMRVTGNAAGFGKDSWDALIQYENTVNTIIGKQRMIALCTYPLNGSGMHEIVDAAYSHQYVINKRNGKLELFANPEREYSRKIFDYSIEQQVVERTGGLKKINDELCREIAGRKRIEDELKISIAEKNKSINDMRQLMVFSDFMRNEIQEKELINHLARALKKRFQPNLMAVLMLNKDKNMVEIPIIDPVMPPDKVLKQEIVLDPNMCRAMRTGHSVIVNDFQKELCCDCIIHAMRENGHACFPIVSGNGAIGAVLVVKKNEGYWMSEEEQKLFSTYVGMAASSMENVRLVNLMRLSTIKDSLTGLYNRKYFAETLEKLLYLAKRHQETLSVIIAEIDDFIHFNDMYGCLAGDRILQLMGTILKDSIKPSDILCRYGGKQFTIIMPKTSMANAQEYADKIICQRIDSADMSNIVSEKNKKLTVSIGIASFPEHGAESQTLMTAIDHALLKARTAQGKRA